MGQVELRRGELQAAEFRGFLTNVDSQFCKGKSSMGTKSSGRGVIKAFCNNYGGNFDEGALKAGQSYSIDDFLAGLFALMPPGSVLVTLHKIRLGLSRTEANEKRRKHGLPDPESDLASFFDMEEVLLGEGRDVANWFGGSKDLKKKMITVFKYTRLCQQSSGDGGSDAVFLCCNANCDFAASKPPKKIEATRNVIQDGSEKVVINTCPCCRGCGIKNLRSRQTKKNIALLSGEEE